MDTIFSDDGALTIEAFCEKYSVSRASAYREIASGALVAKKRGSRTLIPNDKARQWLAALPLKAPAASQAA